MIQVKGLTKRFGEQTVLSGVDLSVADGEIFGLLGPSGAGKTTIINILTRQLTSDSGTFDTGAEPARTGLMLDVDGLYERLSCRDNLELFADIYRVPRQAVGKVLADVGLADDASKPVSKLSRGMRQRLALARAILHRPDVLFLDEPTSGLDPTTARGIHELIEDLREQGTTVFLTTHNMDEAVALCDTVALLHRGVIVEQGAPADICKRHDSFKTVPDLGSVFVDLTGEAIG